MGVAQARNDEAGTQVHAVGVVGLELSSTPEVVAAANIDEVVLVVPVASGQRGKAESIRAVAIIIPARLRF